MANTTDRQVVNGVEYLLMDSAAQTAISNLNDSLNTSGLINHGVLPTSTDIDALTGSRVDFLNSSNTYSGTLPFTSPNGFLITMNTGVNYTQLFYPTNASTTQPVYRRNRINASDVWTSWERDNKISDIAFVSAEDQITDDNVSSYSDFNNLNHLKTYGVHLSAGADIANTPYGEDVPNMYGLLFGASHGNGFLQCYFSYNGDAFYRIYHDGGWWSWAKFSYTSSKNWDHIAFVSAEEQINDINVSNYDDWNDLDHLKTYGVHLSAGADIANTPYGDTLPAMYGLLFSASHGNGYLQCYYSYNGVVYYRIYHNGSWWNWYKISNDAIDSDYANALTGKHWYVCGDSFTHGDFTGIAPGTPTTLSSGKYAGQNRVYPYIIGNRNGVIVHNVSSNGMTLGTKTDGTTTNSLGAIYQSVIDSNADYITFYYGINDAGNCTLGTINDDDLTTFYGAWNTIIEWCLTNRPNAHLGIIISNNVNNTDFTNAVKAIALKWGIPALDMNSADHILVCDNKNPDISSTAKEIADEKFCVSETNIHPNPLCHEMESYFIEQWLLSL